MSRAVCLLLMVAVLAAGFLMLGGSLCSASSHTLPESQFIKAESMSSGNWAANAANPEFVARRDAAVDAGCADGHCKLRHHADVQPKVQVEVTQAEQPAAHHDPLWLPLVVGGSLLLVLIGIWYASALES